MSVLKSQSSQTSQNIKIIWAAVLYICGQLELNEISQLY